VGEGQLFFLSIVQSSYTRNGWLQAESYLSGRCFPPISLVLLCVYKAVRPKKSKMTGQGTGFWLMLCTLASQFSVLKLPLIFIHSSPLSYYQYLPHSSANVFTISTPLSCESESKKLPVSWVHTDFHGGHTLSQWKGEGLWNFGIWKVMGFCSSWVKCLTVRLHNKMRSSPFQQTS
jgi:hypothetical protein